MSYHVDVIPNRNSPPAILFRQAQRDGKRIRRTTLANLSKLPPQIVDGIRAMLRGGQVYRPGEEAFCSRRSLPHGHVAAVLGVWPSTWPRAPPAAHPAAAGVTSPSPP